MEMKINILIVVCITIFCSSILTDGAKIGVNYGTMADYLPSVDQVATLIKNNSIGKMKTFSPEGDALRALANSGIDVIVGLENSRLPEISSSQDAANGWVKDNIRPFYPATNIKYIAVGNEVLTDKAAAQYVSYLVPAMRNIQTAIQNANLQNNIKVSTPHSSGTIDGVPLSKGVFKDNYTNTMSSALKFLSDNGAPFMANVYPYFNYFYNQNNFQLDYALLEPTATAVSDGSLSYKNLFDAIVDSIIAAMEALGYPNIPLIVTESGWPSGGADGADVATVENARAYNNNLIRHVLSNDGTPRRPGTSIDTYIFALFNENNKGGPGDNTERHFGLFYTNLQPVYPVNFSP